MFFLNVTLHKDVTLKGTNNTITNSIVLNLYY